jgi:hypothetical protein
MNMTTDATDGRHLHGQRETPPRDLDSDRA